DTDGAHRADFSSVVTADGHTLFFGAAGVSFASAAEAYSGAGEASGRRTLLYRLDHRIRRAGGTARLSVATVAAERLAARSVHLKGRPLALYEGVAPGVDVAYVEREDGSLGLAYIAAPGADVSNAAFQM